MEPGPAAESQCVVLAPKASLGYVHRAHTPVKGPTGCTAKVLQARLIARLRNSGRKLTRRRLIDRIPVVKYV